MPDTLKAVAAGLPWPALIVDSGMTVSFVNPAGLRFFDPLHQPLPLSFIEVARDTRLEAAVRERRVDEDIALIHGSRVVQIHLVQVFESTRELLILEEVTRLRRLETVRQEFVANLAHELRTPVTSLRLAAESLESDPPETERRRFLTQVISEADNLAAIVDNLRQLAQLEAKATPLRVEEIDLWQLVNEVAERVGGRTRVRLTGAGTVRLWADRGKLAEVLANLIENAVEFSPPDAPIEFAAAVESGRVQIRIRDHGPGISPEHWRRVFERFYKVDPSRASGGSGLGLAIAKHLVLAHEGAIWTEGADGGGQVFVVELPDNDPSRAHNLPLT